MDYRQLGRTDMNASAIYDDRAFNREGQAFDKGETLSGVPYDVGLAAVERLRPLVPKNATLAQLALRWILMFDGVTSVIPGARTAQQAQKRPRRRNFHHSMRPACKRRNAYTTNTSVGTCTRRGGSAFLRNHAERPGRRALIRLRRLHD
jgi:hypothetical protein